MQFPPWWIREIARKIGVFILACLVGFGIMLLVIAPVLWIAWLLLLYAARQT